MPMLQINDQRIGGEEPCYVIAEAGSNHCAKLSYAKDLVNASAEANANAVKFQLFSAERLFSKDVTNLPFLKGDFYDIMKQYEFDPEWLPELNDLCKSNGLDLLASPFDYVAVDILEKNHLPAFKWASGEIVDIDLLRYAAEKMKPMIVSTGMSNLCEIIEAVNTIRSTGNDRIALLHCSSVYPTEVHDANLNMMGTLQEVFDVPIGFSDHTLGVSISLAAVARGAKILEKHLTLDRPMQSPDHAYSLKPLQFKGLVRGIREVELSLGGREKNMIKAEEEVARVARRSLVASIDIEENSILSSYMICVKRPGTGILPKYKSFVIGRRVRRFISKDSVIHMDDLL